MMALAASLAMPTVVVAADSDAQASPTLACRLKGVAHEALCGVVKRPLDPAQATGGVTIDVHYAVLPAVARNKKPDPVLFFAGGPGQSAIELASTVSSLLARFGNRRDIILVDQRGTGKSAALGCDKVDPWMPLAQQLDPKRAVARIKACVQALSRLPHGDLRQYTTTIAMGDADAVRRALGVERVNLVGMSYGTRAALEYMRLHPKHVRSAVLDGVVPPDMVLPASASMDNQAAFDAVLQACDGDEACHKRLVDLRGRWDGLLASMPRTVTLTHPMSGRPETLTLEADTLRSAVRWPLYMPLLASALPQAIDEAARGRFEPIAALAGALSSGGAQRTAEGMHFAVVCAEDWPRLAQSQDAPGRDFGDSFLRTYREMCEGWPAAAVPQTFYDVPKSEVPVLLLSGGADPVTPPRHGERTARMLGEKAIHVVVPQASHGVLSVPCIRDAVYRFVDGLDEPRAVPPSLDCAARMPRPRPFLMPQAKGGVGATPDGAPRP